MADIMLNHLKGKAESGGDDSPTHVDRCTRLPFYIFPLAKIYKGAWEFQGTGDHIERQHMFCFCGGGNRTFFFTSFFWRLPLER